ncbi:3-oxoacyl-(acyl-carrier-protein) synthase III [Solidesulfovibrio carbinoliphilus subsp. oakridgensis]|uniref:Beta-ketoacyl-[acyl-carrier-protein] synthase III n=1 Tax=Solidesulfovibrio carbinoliphilus subsp. oakridgensis TaxID=694327 RepID=G7QA22_9BACT|nr:beta-ketoacyl-ACP synthase III [Solidesulfovibrio carbinoliphilus]EHJ47852.1 3-oxoacyl-(acyl-carrier-protein) synthase III [Solidesulfovibrio carbinoliphilus subsp. oakridgensis]
MKQDAYIHGLGFYAPEKVLTNADLEKLVETSDEWITTRTGIKERHIAAPGEATSDMAAAAAKAALADAGLAADALTHIFLYTVTPDYYTPSASCLMQEKLGIRGRVVQDVNAACCGYIYGLEMARAVVALHPEAKVLVAAAEVLTSRTNWADRRTCVLFGDAAAAAVVTGQAPAAGGARIIDTRLASDGSLGHLLTIKGGGSGHPYKLGDVIDEDFFLQMNGPEVYKHAVRSMATVCEEVVAANGLSWDDIDLFIPHQANLRIMEAVAKKLTLPREKVMVTVDRYGNTSASTIGIALVEARAEGRIKPGSKVLLGAFGGGFTWGAAILQF